MPGKYAATTTVPVARTREQIERALKRWGATQFAYGWDEDRALIEFVAGGRRIRFILYMPDPAGLTTKQWEQQERQHWRALLLVITAKLEAVEVGISDFESEFLANIVTSDNRTIGDHLIGQLDAAFLQGPLALMPGS